jgi:geranylgeranyl pyrophosphate synthase
MYVQRSFDKPIALLIGKNYAKNEYKIIYDSQSQRHRQKIVAARLSDIIIGQQEQLKNRYPPPPTKRNYIPEKCTHR